MSNPLVSIVMNCYNSDQFLKEAIDSVYNQTYTNWEIIFWDNASTDNSADIAQSFDDRLRYYLAPHTTPLGVARNFALNKTSGEYIAFLDCDDIYLSSKLELQVKLMQSTDFNMIYGSVDIINETGQKIRKRVVKNKSGDIFSSLLRQYEINMQTVMVRKDFIVSNKLSFNSNMSFSPDHNLFMIIASMTDVGVIQDDIAKYRIVSNSLSNNSIDIASQEYRLTLDEISKRSPELRDKFSSDFESAYNKAIYYEIVSDIKNQKRKQARYKTKTIIYSRFEYFLLYLLLLVPISNKFILKLMGKGVLVNQVNNELHANNTFKDLSESVERISNSGKIIAITGGSGFIGKRLVNKHIKHGDQVRFLSRKQPLKNSPAQYFFGDLASPDVELAGFLNGVDILYHCAGEVNDEALMHKVHVNGTQALVDAAIGKVGCWVQLSSVGVYGKRRSGVVNENTKEKPIGIYEKAKAQSDNIVRHSGIPFVIIRPSNVFGSDMGNQSLRGLLKAVRKGLFFFIGSPGAILNYVHVNDVVESLMLCGGNKKALGETFIISQSIKIEVMIDSFRHQKKLEKKIFRVSEANIRRLINFLKFFHISSPLSQTRVDALTGQCIYNSNKVQEGLEYKYSMPLKEGFELFANQKK